MVAALVFGLMQFKTPTRLSVQKVRREVKLSVSPCIKPLSKKSYCAAKGIAVTEVDRAHADAHGGVVHGFVVTTRGLVAEVLVCWRQHGLRRFLALLFLARRTRETVGSRRPVWTVSACAVVQLFRSAMNSCAVVTGHRVMAFVGRTHCRRVHTPESRLSGVHPYSPFLLHR